MQLATMKTRIERWSSGQEPLPERHRDRAQQYLETRKVAAAEQSRLIESIERILLPVSAIEEILANPPAQGGARELVRRIGDLFRTLAIENWLQPPPVKSASRDRQVIAQEPVPWVEYEKDQQAYFKLL